MHHGRHFAPQFFNLCVCRDAALNQHHNIIIAIFAFNRECRNVTGLEGFNLLGGPLNILRPDIAAIMQDQVLGAARDDDFAIQQIAHVARGQKSIGGNHRVRGLRIVIIARHQAWPLHEDMANLAVP